MSLKRKIAIRISVAFSLLFAMVMAMIYISFSDFRREEFENRFRQRLVFTINFIEQSKDFDEEAPVFFNENSDNVLLNEQILIFNEHKKLIYSTVKDETIKWDDYLLEELDKTNTIYKEKSVPEVYAVLRKIKNKNYYILTSAKDVNGIIKLNYLKYLLIFAFVFSVLLIGFLSYYFMRKFLTPLEKLNQKISNISTNSLMQPIEVANTHDEIAMLTKSFNTMLERLNKVFEAQKSFTSSASHEIKTPLTRMAFQLENMKSEKNISFE
ncbi:MAG: HAMP domain-containing protein, partial [Bacteroidetes bacterium]|nr:HAMP domain-containing protein [Bacteroidota bacterium]